jgi:starch synthase
VRVVTPLYGSIDRKKAAFREPAPHLRDVPVRFGGRTYAFSLPTAVLPGTQLSIHFVDCPALYDREGLYTRDPDEHLRFALLSRAAIEGCQRMQWRPDIIHCHDWHASLTPLYLKTLYAWDALFHNTRTVLTIHNIGYQGLFTASIVPDLGLAESAHLFHNEDLRAGRVNYLKTGILYADVLTTVSRTYALEIQTEEFGAGLQDLLRARRDTLFGIVNGVDYSEWSPASDPHIPHPYGPKNLAAKARNTKVLLEKLGLAPAGLAPVLGVISRLTMQKGFELFYDTMPDLLSRRDARLAVLGTGEARLEEFFQRLQSSFPLRVCFYQGFSNELAHLIEAGSDMFLMPSRYEPCGLNQLYSLKYGTVPVVRKTGGLADTVEPFDPSTGRGTGFVFEHFTQDGLRRALNAAFEIWPDRKTWKQLMLNGMSQDWSWDAQGRHYVNLYARLAGRG